MKFFELIDRNIYRRVINIEYHNDQDVLIHGMKEKKKMKINTKDSYLIDNINEHLFSLFFKRHVYSEGIDSLDVEMTIRIKCAMRRDKRQSYSFLNMDVNDIIKNNTNIVFAGVPHTCSALLSNIMMSFGENPLILPPKLNLTNES
ncbi:MAG: hypothetical protein UMR38_06625 [Candidatus Izemoplasma sp.]|nr:hypothetical protein [Candidatus Izemoplasma sp.]